MKPTHLLTTALFTALILACLAAPAAAFSGAGSGTEADPYIITTPAQLQSIRDDLTAYYKLGNDINLQDVSFIPIGSTSSSFTGSFDGAGYTISNMVISSSTQSTGFFRCLGSGATIKDVTFADCTVSSTSAWTGTVVGGIIMSATNHDVATINNVDCVRCDASTTSYNVACLVGTISTSAIVEIMDCDVSYSKAESTNGDSTGCFVGACNGASSTEITRCNVLYSHARGSAADVGCFVGYCGASSSLVIDSSSAQNSIAECVNSNNVGCLLGECSDASSVNALNCDVVNCLAMGIQQVGGLYGIVGGGSIAASDCTITGCTIVATTKYAGGIAGRCLSGTTGIFSDCSGTDSTIIASNYAAGICPAYS